MSYTDSRRISVAIALGSLALGLGLSHAFSTRGDHHRIEQLQQRVEQLDRTDGMQDAGLQGTYDGLDERLDELERREKAARASRSRRPSAAPQAPTEAARWASSADAVRVANCESADLPHWPDSDGSRYVGGERGVHLRDPNGHDGKWQFAPATWRSVGGTGRAYDATETEQDYRAWLLWKREGWQSQWTCARKLGIR